MLRRSLAIAGLDLRILLRDPAPLVLLFVLPLALVAFLKPALRTLLESRGYPDATGAEQAVPGMAVAFSLFLTGFVALVFFREHGWGTWDRVRASPTRPSQIVLGKLLPVAAVGVLQMVLLFGVGVVAFELRVPSVPAIVLAAISFVSSVVVMGVALVAHARTLQQANAFANLGAVVFAALGGALVPLAELPGWARAVAPATPTYWAMKSFRSVLLEGGGVADVLIPAGLLLAFTAAFAVVAVQRFSLQEAKSSWE